MSDRITQLLAPRPLGRSGVKVSSVGLGCAPLGEMFALVDEDTAQRTLQAAWDRGIRYFDTAPEYGMGLSEQRVGRFLRYQDRSSFVLSTKIGRVLRAPRDGRPYRHAFWHGGLEFYEQFDYSYDGVMRSFEDSMLRLGLNRIDCLLIHDLDIFTHGNQQQVDAHMVQLLTGGWRALKELKDTGVIGAIGAGLNDQSMIMRFLEATDLDFLLMAMRYTLLDQLTLDAEMARCQERGIGVVIGGLFNSGIGATGAVPRAWFNYRPATEQIMEKVRAIEAVCARHNVKLPAAALHFPLFHPAVAAIIPGAIGAAQLEANFALLDTQIPAAFWQELKSQGLMHANAPVGSP